MDDICYICKYISTHACHTVYMYLYIYILFKYIDIYIMSYMPHTFLLHAKIYGIGAEVLRHALHGQPHALAVGTTMLQGGGNDAVEKGG